MKTEDFERIKSKLGDEFKAEYRVEKDSVMVLVTKKDPWDGVEFVEYKDFNLTGGQRYFKINWIDNQKELIHIHSGYLFKKRCKPSTEEAYVKQLKKEAFDRFGEIKEWDRFIDPDGLRCKISSSFYDCGNIEWYYDKKEDMLIYYSLVVYQKGKWAERVKERVNIYIEPYESESEKTYPEWIPNATFKFISTQKIKLDGKVGKFLASQLEKYLNDEI